MPPPFQPTPGLPVWHIVEASSVPITEFASALGKFVPVLAWKPERRMLRLAGGDWLESLADPPVTIAHFNLQRGFSRPIIRNLLPSAPKLKAQLLSHSPHASHSPLICTTPFYAPLAEIWPGPVVYYLTDLTIAYAGLNSNQVRSLDKRLCAVACAVCPNSKRIADYLKEQVGCDPQKITVVPNAARSSSLRFSCSVQANDVPDGLLGLTRPIAGIVGNLAGNLDWELLQKAVERTPWLSWAFVGPVSMKIPDAAQSRSRNALLAQGGRARFVGAKPYSNLKDYARAFDVAILPYQKIEPTFSGSSTRYYEHLAAGRPMISTRGVEELLHQEPLLRLVSAPDEMVQALEDLRNKDFRDGHRLSRLRASENATWEQRAMAVLRASGIPVPEPAVSALASHP